MSFNTLLTRTATVEPYGPTEVDDFNDEIRAFGTPVAYPAWFNSLGDPQEITVGRDTVVVSDLVVLPPNAVISHLSRVTRDDGQVFEVIGAPDRVYTPRGEHHVEAKLRAILG